MINEIIKQLNIPGKLIYLSQYGSHLYGLNTENSDLDFRGVYIPNLDDIILHKDKDEINEELEITYQPPQPTSPDGMCTLAVFIKPKTVKVDVKIFSLQKFIQLCSKADTNALDLLFSLKTSAHHQWKYEGLVKNVQEEMKYPLRFIYDNRDKLINTDRMQSPCEYAHKQATKYGLKIERYNAIKSVLDKTKLVLAQEYDEKLVVGDLFNRIADLCDDKHVKIVELDNHGKLENYLYVAGVNHMLNLPLDQFIQRLEDKLKYEYFSERTTKAINSKDEVDWKAMSHALRVSLEIKELLETGNITFPLKEKEILLDIKQGKVDKTEVAEKISNLLEEILDDVMNDKLGWKYNETLWDLFILNEVKHG